MSNSFFSKLQGFSDFTKLADESNYEVAPRDCWVVITDVKGSTKAIEEGKYKTVNLMGAATLAAIINTLGTRQFPFVFGGDGASALIPDKKLEQVKQALNASRKMAQVRHGLEMRVGIVPHEKILQAGEQIKVAKYNLNQNNSIAFFRGQGLSLAEKWVKSGEYLIDEQTKDLDFDPHKGLSCRWAPIHSTRGEILSLLIKFKSEKNLDLRINEISEILKLDESAISPVKVKNFTNERVLRSARLEASLSKESYKALIKNILFLWLVIALDKGWLPRKIFDLDAYKRSVTVNSDFKKFDELLRMVVDVTPELKNQIISKLDEWSVAGDLIYGVHSSPSALMTCFVEDTNNDQHIHFIDGSDGGYAMAAKDLKKKMKNNIQ
jgi:hypothetical protein